MLPCGLWPESLFGFSKPLPAFSLSQCFENRGFTRCGQSNASNQDTLLLHIFTCFSNRVLSPKFISFNSDKCLQKIKPQGTNTSISALLSLPIATLATIPPSSLYPDPSLPQRLHMAQEGYVRSIICAVLRHLSLQKP